MRPEEGMKKQIDIYSSMSGVERLQIAFELYDSAVAICRAGIKWRHPDWDDEEIDKQVISLLEDAAT
ncbi:MAG: hypothetical protein ACLFPU_07055 [Dehalococcoidia bacterium]